MSNKQDFFNKKQLFPVAGYKKNIKVIYLFAKKIRLCSQHRQASIGVKTPMGNILQKLEGHLSFCRAKR